MNQQASHFLPQSPQPIAEKTGLYLMQLPFVQSERTHHDRVIHASHLENVHRDLCAVGDLIAACMVGWREVEVGAVWLPVEKVMAQSAFQLSSTACTTITQQPGIPLNVAPFSTSPSILCFYFHMAEQALLRQTVAWWVKQAETWEVFHLPSCSSVSVASGCL